MRNIKKLTTGMLFHTFSHLTPDVFISGSARYFLLGGGIIFDKAFMYGYSITHSFIYTIFSEIIAKNVLGIICYTYF